jgi:hypothetical protein
MPVSPQDFATWSELTGNPYPQTPGERMALAPQVYEFNRNLGRRGGPEVNPLRRAVDVVGKAALAAGALAGAAYLGSKYFGKEDKEEEPLPTTPVASGANIAPAQSATPADLFIEGIGKKETFSGYPSFIEESVRGRAQMFLDRMGVGKLELDNEPAIGSTIAEAAPDLNSQVAQNSGDVTPIPTSGRYSQNLNPNQTSAVQEAKGLSSFKPTTNPIEEKPATQNEVITTGQHFSPGTEEEMLGQNAAERAAAFRKSKAYAVMQQQYPGLQDIESPTQPASTTPVVLKDVNVGEALRAKGLSLAGDPTDPHGLSVMTEKGGEYLVSHPYAEHPKAGIRQTALQEQSLAHELLARAGVTPESAKSYFAEKFGTPAQSVVTESPIAAMAQPAQAPVTASVDISGGASMREIRELDATLARSMARNTPEQRAAVRDQLLAKKYPSVSQEASEAVVTPTQPVPVRVAVETTAKPARVRANEFLSQMSQEQGPIATYEIDPSRSKAVSGVAFYPGGEIGVTVPTKTSGKKEYAFATSDPYRLALSDYAEEGFPTGMGSITGTVAPRNLAHQLGLQKTVTPGGSLAADQPSYSGLMDAAQIAKKLRSRSENVRSQAQYHADTKEVLNAIESRHPQPPMSPEEISRLRQERQAIRSVGLS